MNAPASARPNIVYILADDLGYGDVSCLNPASRIPTPHHDQLARSGMTFTDMHSNSAVCTPTRYGVLTGRYAWRGHLKSSVLNGYSRALIEKDRATVASFLRDQGYRTACIGKWHLGLDFALRDGHRYDEHPLASIPLEAVDPTQRLTAGPHTVGFDESYILPASLDMPPYVYVENGYMVAPPDEEVPESPRPAFWRGGAAAPGFDHATCLLELTKRAEAWIGEQARHAGEQPFFLYFPTPSPHTPHFARPPFAGKSQAGIYGDFVCEHDWSVGQIVAALERHGLRENTLIIVTSDNGAHCRGADGVTSEGFDFARDYGHHSNHHFRGQKSDAWDGGHRIPFLASWPGVIPAGTQCDATACLTDLFATAADLCAEALPDDAAEDSFSLVPLLRGGNGDPDRAVVHHSIRGAFALRLGEWKLVESPGSGGWSLKDDDVPVGAPERQLYHIADDVGENRNLIATEAPIADRLQARLDAIRSASASR